MSSSSFMLCPRRSDRGTPGWSRKFSAVLNIKQAAARRLNKQASCFCKRWICSSFLTFLPASVVCTEVLYQSLLGARPCSISGSLPKPPLFTTTRSSNCIETIICRFQRSTNLFKLNMKWEGGEGGADEPKWNRAIFFFSTKKMAIEMLLRCQKVVPYYTLMYAHKHSLTHSDAITCTFNSDTRTEHDCDVFYNCFSENVLHFVFAAQNAA